MTTAGGWPDAAPRRATALFPEGTPRRLVAATCVMFAALAAFLASGVTISAVRAAPPALTAPDFDTAGTPTQLDRFAAVPDAHAGDPAGLTSAAGPAAVGPEAAASCGCPAQAVLLRDGIAERERSGIRSHLVARAPPRTS
ncbi:hypothetical protein [Pseudonocardia sp. GCM10023141]|uniref:hypothetical protein n=1 Tax=Pseudonocardia sp. GCM10023141 TaxID=3252653 RepID=UPI0036175295